jgi:hypothetical protein
VTSRSLRTVAVGLLTTLVLGGCAALQRGAIASTEQLLEAAGFTMQPADTPERLAQLEAMPAHTLVTRSEEGHAVYAYADPGSCTCVYLGGPGEYSTYMELARQAEIARQLRRAALQGPPINWTTWPYL